jgi:RNA polymerase sigma factor (sigma-70 family)
MCSPVSVRMRMENSPAGTWPKPLGPIGTVLLNRVVGVTEDSENPADMSELLERVGQTADVSLFEELFKQFAPRVKSYMARSGSPGSAEELMQETMVAVWNKSALYDRRRGSAATWIFTIARNLRIDAYRHEKHPEYDEDDPALQPETSPSADKFLEANETAAAVRAALTSLPADQAEVLRLAYFEDKSQTAVAAALSVPLGTVKSRMRLAFTKLRAALGEERSE